MVLEREFSVSFLYLVFAGAAINPQASRNNLSYRSSPDLNTGTRQKAPLLNQAEEQGLPVGTKISHRTIYESSL